ncbi:MAG: site-2 protease family protein, partial [Verrucomicrobiales bacterium]
PQMAPMDAIEGKGGDGEEEPLPKISPLDKIIVAFAGPLFSFGLAFCFAVLVWGLGKPERASSATTVIGYVEADGPADQAGLKEGDRVVSIDGAKIRHFSSPVDSVVERVMFSRNETMDWVVERGGQELPLSVGYVKVPLNGSKRAPIRTVGVAPLEPAIVGAFLDGGTPAERAGFKAGDVIKSVDGQTVYSYMHFGKLVRASEGKQLAVGIVRDGEAMTLELVPEKPVYDKPLEDGKQPQFMAGIIQRAPDDLTLTKPGPKPMVQLQDSLTMMFRTIGGLFSSKSDISPTHMSSAVGIGNIYYKMLSDPKYGWLMAIWFSVLLNVNLAILNMLPFPVLDGGHITIALMEAVRRRPVNVRVLEYIQVVCVVALMGFMLFVTFFDTTDIFGDNKKGEAPPKPSFRSVEEAAEPASETVPSP